MYNSCQMKKENIVKLDQITNELSYFLEKDFSSKFKELSDKEDRQLFFLAKLLTRLKTLSKEMKEEKVVQFPTKLVSSGQEVN